MARDGGADLWPKRCSKAGMRIDYDKRQPVYRSMPQSFAGQLIARLGQLRAQASGGQNQTRQPYTRGGVGFGPPSWLQTARRWSPGIVPPMLGGLLLLVGVVLATQRGTQRPLIAPHSLLPLFLIYLIFGTIYGLALHFAPTTYAWLGVLAGGALVYVAVTLWVIGGVAPLAIFLIVLLIVAYVYVRTHMRTVAKNQVIVTELAGGHSRTLGTGAHVLLPGEQVLATVEIGERQLAVPAQQVELADASGEPYVAQAAALLAFVIQPDQAHLVALGPEEWEDELRERASAALRRSLAEWGRRMLTDDEELPEGMMAKTALRLLSDRMRPRGLRIRWMRVRDIWLRPAGEVVPVDDWEHEQQPPAEQRPWTPPAAPAPPAPYVAPHADPPPLYPPRGEIRAPMRGPAPRPALPQPAHEPDVADEAFPPEALRDAYEAVRANQITDPQTIREIAQGFLHVAHNPALAETLTFDAGAAARILLDRAAAIEQQSPH
ncbi:MAG: hypothetical protein OJF49_003672 [Ktedonobacterales bacterium]|nr:MAG: hypothetical protein OJF49_003672 [Ktedonobacterales bacterium]